jgi:aspartate carbamoyltransferase catalytic subunit
MNLISIWDLDTEDLVELTDPRINERTAHFAPLRGTIAFLFEQPSLRTVSSFAAAATRLGLAPVCVTTNGRAFRADIDIVDEIHQLALTSEAVVMRTSRPISSTDFSRSSAPVINAGDGTNEHPTQALLDVTIMRHFGLDGKTVALLGNLRDQRSSHSLAIALHRLGVHTRLISSRELAMDESYVGSSAEVHYAETRAERDRLIADADFIYLPSLRGWNALGNDYLSAYAIDSEQAKWVLKPTAKILSPFPRFGELDRSLDGTVYDAYHLQTATGPLVRARVLIMLLSRTARLPFVSGTSERPIALLPEVES